MLQDHHDQPGSISEEQLFAAFSVYVQRWDGQIRKSAYRFTFTDDDTSTVVQETLVEFYLKKIKTGIFDPSLARSEHGHFAILKKLLVQRGIDHWRHLQTPGARPDIEVLARPNDETADPFPGTATSTEDTVLGGDDDLEQAMTRMCEEAGLDDRRTAIMINVYLDHFLEWEQARSVPGARQTFWEELARIVNAQFPPPVSWQTIRNLHLHAKTTLRDHLDSRRHHGPGEDDA